MTTCSVNRKRRKARSEHLQREHVISRVGGVSVPVHVHADPAGNAFPFAAVSSSCASTCSACVFASSRVSPGIPSWDSAAAGIGVPVMSSATARVSFFPVIFSSAATGPTCRETNPKPFSPVTPLRSFVSHQDR